MALSRVRLLPAELKSGTHSARSSAQSDDVSRRVLSRRCATPLSTDRAQSSREGVLAAEPIPASARPGRCPWVARIRFERGRNIATESAGTHARA